MSFKPNLAETYVRADGHLTLEGLKVLQGMYDRLGDAEAEIVDLRARLVAVEGKLAAMAAVTPPAGGATVDTEGRTAITDLITGAG